MLKRSILIVFVFPLVAGIFSCTGPRIQEQVARGRQLMAEGKYSEAFSELDGVVQTGKADGRILFEAYDCLRRTAGDPARMEELRQAGMEKLEKAVQEEDSEVTDFYYFASLQYDAGSPVEGAKTGLDAVQRFLGPPGSGAGPGLSALEYYQLGEIYHLMHREDLGEEVFAKAAGAYQEMETPPVDLFARSLVEAAKGDLRKREYGEAAEKIDRARTIDSEVSIDPLAEGLIMMGARRFKDAETAWHRVLEPADLILECQIRAAVARKSARYKNLPTRGPTGLDLAEYNDEQIETNILELVVELREFKKIFIPGWKRKPSSPAFQLTEDQRKSQLAGMRKVEKKFLALHREYLLRDNSLQAFASRNRYRDLLRY